MIAFIVNIYYIFLIGLNSPAKHVVPVVATQTAQPPALQIQQSLLTQVITVL